MTAALAGFALFALMMTVVPGPDTLLVLRNCLRGGRRSGAATALGAAAGSLAWAVAAAFGLAAALQRWDAAFTAVRLLGAGYLAVLGLQALWACRRSAAPGPEASPEAAPEAAATALRGFRQGLLSCLLNPKVGIFFVAVVPQFLPPGRPVLGATLLLGAVDAVIAAGWLLLIALGAGRLSTWLRRPRVLRGLEGTTGGVLVALGVGTALETARG
ncbi:LysE family translocator [Streptomyces catenulae]|uniref:LysE family translocator n=1 Tax=Streptomyces catenulae TaxID=66875 RepID=A0ABV2Z2R4_9ACTN|nr:LysE family translocator [Streptomyces catenulae]